MKTFESIFQRNVRTLIWVVFALMGLLPILALGKAAIVLSTGGQDSYGYAQAVALALFAFVSLVCGLFVLLTVEKHLREVAAQGVSLTGVQGTGITSAEATLEPSDAFMPRPAGNELTSLTCTLSRIQSEFTRNLEHVRTQADFLENLQRALDRSGDMVIILNRNNTVLFSNRAARQKLGLLPDLPVRHAIQEGILSSAAASRLSGVLECWQDVDEELDLEGGGDHPLFIHCLQTVVESGTHPHSKIVVLRDLTDRKRMECQLFRSEQLAALGQLISGVAHELNNPLTAVLGFAEICRDPAISQKDLQNNLEIIEREASRTAHVVENLLNFSRQRNAKRAMVDVHKLLERCFALLAYIFRTNNVSVHREYSSRVPLLEMDEYQMQQVFMNIIINAAQAMREAGTGDARITVRTSLSDDLHTVCVDLQDNGPGIAPAVLPHIFDPFFTTKGDDQGTGLGLTVSRGIVREHKGDIAVSTRFGEGTTFHIRLPLPGYMSSRQRDEEPQASSSQTWGRVLVVDDEPSILAMADQALSAQGLRVSTATTIAAAIALLRDSEFDVVIADMCMPDGEGTEIWRYVRSTDRRSVCRVLFATGAPDLAADLKHRLGEDVPTLLKPFHLQELCGTVVSQLQMLRKAAHPHTARR